MRISRINQSLVILALILGIAFILFTVWNGARISSLIKQDQSTSIQSVAQVQPTTDPQPATASTETSTAAITPAVTEAAPAEAVAAAQVPQYKYGLVMSAAGIDSTDFSYVTDMVLNDNGWRMNGPNLWAHAVQGGTEPLVWNLQRVDHYVLQTYGSWSAAHSQWIGTGDF